MVDQSSWLVMLYLAADDLLQSTIRSATIEDNCVRLLEGIRKIGHLDPSVKIVALFDNNIRPDSDRSDEARSYYPSVWELRSGSSGQLGWVDVGSDIDVLNELFVDGQTKRECDTGDFRTLSVFADWALKTHQRTYSMLAIVGHGGGWAATLDGAHKELADIRELQTEKPNKLAIFSRRNRVSRAQASGVQDNDSSIGGSGWLTKKGWSPGLTGLAPDYSNDSALSTQELRLALELALRGDDGKSTGDKIDVLFLDACLMSMVEVAYELRDCVSHLVAGQNLLWASLPYGHYFQQDSVLRLPDTPADLAIGLVENYNISGTQKSWELSAIRTDGLEALATAINDLSAKLLAMLDADQDNRLLDSIFSAYAAAQKFDYDCDFSIEQATEGYVDLYDFVDQLIGTLGALDNVDQTVIKQAQEIKRLIGDQARIVATVQSDGEKTIQPSSRGSSISDSGIIMRALVQTDDRQETMGLREAYGLSIYLPLGEEERHNDTAAGLLGQRTLLDYYSDRAQLQFTRACTQWPALIKLLIDLDAKGSSPRRRVRNASPYETARQR